jgi:hypothetical protein
VHAADMAVGNGAGQTKLAPETLDRFFVRGDIRVEQLEGQLLPDLGIKNLVDAAHAALAQLLDDLIAAGERRTGGQLTHGYPHGFGGGWRAAFGAERSGAPAAETRARGIVKIAPGALHDKFPYNWTPDWSRG